MLDNNKLGPLLARVALKDRGAFRQLYELAGPHLYGAALRILRNPALAEDAVQDAFVQIWNNAHVFRAERAQPSAWINSIIRYRALDLLRTHGRDLPLDEVSESALATNFAGNTPEPALMRCMDELGPDARTCITLAFVEGYSHDELRRRYKKPLGTIKSWIRRGLQQLKECLER